MASGVKAAKECLEKFEELKTKKQHRYMTFKLTDALNSIIVENMEHKDKTFEDFRQELLGCKEADGKPSCRYGVFDLDFEFNGNPKKKLVFVSWCPENSKVKHKMVYASSKDYLKKTLKVVPELQATDEDELTLANLTEKAQHGMKD